MKKPPRKPFPGRNRTAGRAENAEAPARHPTRKTRHGRPAREEALVEPPARHDRHPKKAARDGRRPGPRRQAPATGSASEKTVRFSDLLMAKARAAHPDKVGPASSPEPLARLDYESELELKNQALQEFWSSHDIPDKPNRILPSPRPRKYRVTTKRRVIAEHGRFRLDFQPEKREAGQARLGAGSELEPEEHGRIYAFLLEKLNSPAYAGLGHVLNFLVIRGDYHRFAVFFNVNRINGEIARKAKLLAAHLQQLDFPGARGADKPKVASAADAPKVASAWLFFDPERSPFYLDDRAPEGPWKLKRLFGPDTVRLRVGERSFAFKPTAFCQVNASVLPQFLEKAGQLLKPRPEQRLLDLYCGFGFFSLPLSHHYREVVGVDAAGPAIESARDMASEAGLLPGPSRSGGASRSGAGDKGQGRVRFLAGRIHASSLGRLLPKPDDQTQEAVLLDPPRHGVEPGVIRELAARKPARVLHVFCDMDTLPREVNQWRKSGYMIAKVVPVDMFPGTDNLEVMVAFIPDKYGILNRIEAPSRNPLNKTEFHLSKTEFHPKGRRPKG
jgi:tRNA/tmRNA/rRNA uracil-C5-methylase (TrmA/RlmC/RlmD family)